MNFIGHCVEQRFSIYYYYFFFLQQNFFLSFENLYNLFVAWTWGKHFEQRHIWHNIWNLYKTIYLNATMSYLEDEDLFICTRFSVQILYDELMKRHINWIICERHYRKANSSKLLLLKLLPAHLDPIYTGLVTTVQVLYLLEICCLGWVFIILYGET